MLRAYNMGKKNQLKMRLQSYQNILEELDHNGNDETQMTEDLQPQISTYTFSKKSYKSTYSDFSSPFTMNSRDQIESLKQ